MTHWQNFYHDATEEELDDRVDTVIWATVCRPNWPRQEILDLVVQPGFKKYDIPKECPAKEEIQTFETKRMCFPPPFTVHCPNCSTEHETYNDNAYCPSCSSRFRIRGAPDFIHRETGELKRT